jgi:naphtho-gamma-pyrone polyketide synthase
VVSGRNVDIDPLHDRLAKKGLKSTKVKVPYAFHSSQMDAILKDLEIAAQSVEFREPRIPIISPSAGKVITAKNAHILNTGYLSRHCRGAVNFVAGINAAIAAKVIVPGTSWVELGPHSVCSSFLKANLGPETIAVPSLRRNEDVWKVLTGSLSALYRAGANIRWYEYHRDFSGSHEVLPLPAYKWDNKNHWIQYVHDWTLSKGDAPVARLITEPVAESVGTLFSTTSVQRIVENVAKDSKIIVVAESSFSHQQLSAVAKGHKVNGVQLCPSVSHSWRPQ